MTQHWIDLQHSDCIMIIGSNAAENHPMSFKWVTKATENGAKLISVDPRFTRTSAKADIYGQLRVGTDIAFIGGIINYCIQNLLYNERYLKECTNACFLINPEFETCRDPGHSGVFSGLSGSAYDKSTWQYQLDGNGNPIKVADLEGTDPGYPGCKTSFSLLKEQFSTYTTAKVCEITGMDSVVFNEICQTYCATAPDDKSATIMYAMGATQHTYGTQNVRSYAILQLLLGNIGVAGGGINALRGESNVQGSTDMCLLFHILPGYLATPDVKLAHRDLDAYITNRTPITLDPSGTTNPASANWWQYTNKYICSLLKAWWPDADTDAGGNDIKPVNAYNYLPKKNGDCSHITIFEKMLLGDFNGLMCWGQNPAVGGPNSNKERDALANLDFLVCVDLWETETAGFWKRPGIDPATINTEVWMLPAAASFEKEGSITNSGRWMQWRYKAATPPGDALEDLEILRELGVALQGLAASGTSLGDLNWGPYPGQSYSVPATPHEVAKEINGYYLRGHASQSLLVTSFAKLEDSGQTSSGNWLYCDSYDEDGNKAERTSLVDAVNEIGLYPGFSWCWPVNRRIIYNRASTYQSGVEAGDPLAPQKWVVRWTGSAWEGDVPDHGAAPGGVYPFIMKPEGHARLHGMGRVDGPFPEHYEPWERPVNNAMSPQENNPVIYIYDPTEQGDALQFPIIGTTYRVTEHWQGGAMTRNMPWLCELMPDVFCEISEELATAKGISNGDLVTTTTERGSMQAVACVTKRLKPLDLNGVTKHQVGFVWHWGYQGYATGNSANILTSHIGDANTRIPEYKAFLCDINKT